MHELIGKKAYKKRGLFSGLVGTIEKCDSGITPYKLVYKEAGSTGIRRVEDIVVVKC